MVSVLVVCGPCLPGPTPAHCPVSRHAHAAARAGERNLFSVNMLVGCAIFLGGLAVYSHYKVRIAASLPCHMLETLMQKPLHPIWRGVHH